MRRKLIARMQVYCNVMPSGIGRFLVWLRCQISGIERLSSPKLRKQCEAGFTIAKHLIRSKQPNKNASKGAEHCTEI